MKVFKVMGIVVVVLVVFIALAVYMTANNLNSIVKQVVEQVGTETLKTTVSLDAADINLMDARAKLTGLTIQNMPGFKEKNLFEMDGVLIDLNLNAVMEHRIDITEVSIQGLRVAAEQKGTTTNIQQMLNQLSKGKAASGKSEQGQSGAAPSDLLVRVGKFEFANSETTLVTEQWGDRKLSVPTITLTNIGGDKGVPPDQIAAAIFNPLLKKINRAAEDQLKNMVENEARGKLKEKENELKDKTRAKLKEKLGGF